jgi:hypothetical protein
MILTLGIFSLIIFSLNITVDNKTYVEAIEITNQKMEQIRNLPYTDVGTLTGSPHGVIPDYETINREGVYTVHTTVMFYDDEYDGTIASGTDSIFIDYKIATVEVNWQSKFGQKKITVFSKIIPSTEETLEGYGLLKIIVVDANGVPVANANIHIENNNLSPILSADYVSDTNGNLSLPVLPSFESYEITVYKLGPPEYGIDKTYDRTAENPNPTKPHLSVIEGVKTEESFSIDLLGNLIIRTITQTLPDNWQVNTDSTLKAQSNARVAFDSNGYMYIVWEDLRDTGATKPKVYAQKYDGDGNMQWLPDDVRITTANNTNLPDILVDNAGNLYVCWNDDSTGNQDVYIDKRFSADGSPAWGGANKVNTLANEDNQENPRINISEIGTKIITVVWHDNRNTDLDVFMQRYDDSKTAQLVPEKRINTNATSDGTNQYDPVIISNSVGDIYIAWSDNRNGNFDVYGAKIASATINHLWEQALNTNGGVTDQYDPDIAIDSNDYIYIVWTDERNGDKDIYGQKYDGDGNTQWSNDLRVNTDLESDNQSEPAIAVDNSNNVLYVVWTDEKNGDKDIYGQKYNFNGNAIWANDLRISISTTTSAEYNPDVTINPVTNKPFATWQSDLNGNLDIYVTEFDFYGGTSTIPSVPLIVFGSKRIGEDPVIYEYDQGHITDANGYLNLPVEWDVPGYTVSLKSASTTYTLILSVPTPPMELLPNETREMYLFLE